jgi:hypothetical protein
MCWIFQLWLLKPGFGAAWQTICHYNVQVEHQRLKLHASSTYGQLEQKEKGKFPSLYFFFLENSKKSLK